MFYLFILHIVVITRTCDADLCFAIVNIILFIIPEKRLHGNKIKLLLLTDFVYILVSFDFPFVRLFGIR